MSPLLLWMTGSYLLVKWMANCQQFTTKTVLLYFLPRFPTVRLQLSAVRNKMRSTTQSSMLEILMETFTQSTKRERSSKPQSCKEGQNPYNCKQEQVFNLCLLKQWKHKFLSCNNR